MFSVDYCHGREWAFYSPLSTHTFEHASLYQPRLKTNYQRDNYSCGYRAKAYALALDARVLVQREKSSLVRAYRGGVEDRHNDSEAFRIFNRINPKNGKWAHSDDLITLEQENQQAYKHFYMVGPNPQNGEYISLLHSRSLDSVAASVAEVNKRGHGCVHCICLSNGNHWVLYSYVMPKGYDKPFALYVDSKNTPLTRKHTIYPLIRRLHALCFEPQPINSPASSNKIATNTPAAQQNFLACLWGKLKASFLWSIFTRKTH